MTPACPAGCLNEQAVRHLVGLTACHLGGLMACYLGDAADE